MYGVGISADSAIPHSQGLSYPLITSILNDSATPRAVQDSMILPVVDHGLVTQVLTGVRLQRLGEPRG